MNNQTARKAVSLRERGRTRACGARSFPPPSLFMTCQKSHHLPFDYSLFPPVLTLITAALIIVCFVVLLAVSSGSVFSGRPPGGLPSLTRNPGLAATVPVAPPLSRRGLRSRHPGKRRRNVRSNAVSQTALHVVAAGPCPLFCPVPFTCLSPCRRGHRQPQPAALTVQGK